MRATGADARVLRRVVAVRVFPESNEPEFRAVLTAANEAANALSDVAWAGGVFHKRVLQEAHYEDLRSCYGLSAQVAIRVIGKVADSYRLDHQTKRVFRPDSGVPFDDRVLTWVLPDETDPDQTTGKVSIRGLSGRVTARFKAAEWQMDLLRRYRKGESDLILRDGKWFLYATIAEPAPAPIEPVGFLGVDLGIVNIATTSEGSNFSGGRVNRYRRRQQRLRAELQKRGTKSAKRRLKKRRRKEERFTSDVNHRVSKKIVAEAKRTGSVIVLEDLKGIRSRARSRKPQRTALNSWGFHQLGQYIAYKAERAGVPVLFVDPWKTSQECSGCGHAEKANRRTRDTFKCRSCWLHLPADVNAARVLSKRGAVAWAGVNHARTDQPVPVAA